MGINPTQSNFKSFTFDGVNSRQYGVYITGAGVFNAPERNVEMIDIAGRNGAFVLDKGNFLNIEVTYPASIACDNEADFAQAVSDLRNLLCSKVGYVRLEDDYNPNEYRLAIYKSGLEVSHDFLIAGEFDLVFECKPQRYLKSGETAISVTSGDTVTNPTRFEAKPMIEVVGYGNIGINGDSIVVGDVPIGDVLVEVLPKSIVSKNLQATFQESMFVSADSASLTGVRIKISIGGAGPNVIGAFYIDNISNCSVTYSSSGTAYACYVEVPNFDFTVGTASSATPSTFDALYRVNWGATYETMPVTISINYDGDDGLSYAVSATSPSGKASYFSTITTGVVSGYSTKTISDTIYIDLDIGEVWAEIGGEMTVLNNVTQLPAELPTLSSGANTITYDNTFTSVDIVPRWWKV